MALDEWRTGDIFGGDELPILYAHGHYNRPDSVVLATTEYRLAYAGKLTRVLLQAVDTWHLVWIGFSFADQRIASILRKVEQGRGLRSAPGGQPRHVAIMPGIRERARTPAFCEISRASSTAPARAIPGAG